MNRSSTLVVRNPLTKLPAAQRIALLPENSRTALRALLKEIRADARELAEKSWKKGKGPMAAYWKAVSVYAGHAAHLTGRENGKLPEVTDEEITQLSQRLTLSDLDKIMERM